MDLVKLMWLFQPADELDLYSDRSSQCLLHKNRFKTSHKIIIIVGITMKDIAHWLT